MKLNNNTYDLLKKVALYFLPALATLILAVFTIWNLPYGEQIAGTITAIDTFIGAVLGISSKEYWKKAELVEVQDPKIEGVD